MDWKKAAASMKGSGDGKFINLKDGESVTFAIMGDPGETWLLFPQGGGKPETVKAGTHGAQHKVGLPIYDTKQKCPRLLQITKNTFSDLAELVAELGIDRVYRVSRKGSSLTDTKYTCSGVDRIDDALKATIARETPIDLEEAGFAPLKVVEGAAPKQEPAGQEWSDEKPVF
jgi:hypothetical protein